MARALAVVRGARWNNGGGVVMVSGAPGIGKSALLAEVCRQAARLEVRSAYSKCDPIEQVSPGAPVIAALRAGREPLASAEQYEEIVRAANEPLLLVERIAAVIENAAACAPVLLSIDDVHWADRITRFAIRSLLSRFLGLPVVWLLASRDDDAELVASVDVRAEHIRLAPLTTADLAAIAQDRLGTVPDERTRGFLEASAGSPLLATEVLDNLVYSAARGLADTVPAQFSDAIAQRFSELPEDARNLVEVTAVAGRAISVAEARSLLGQSAESRPGAGLAAAFDSGLITSNDGVLRLSHDLVRDALYSALPDRRVRAWHRKLAEQNLERGQPLVAAVHARTVAAPGDVSAAEIMIAAAEQLAAASPEDAGDLAMDAFRTVRPEQPEWLGVAQRCLSVLCRTQRITDAIDIADVTLAYVDDANLVAAVESEAARALWLSGRLGELLSRVEPSMRAGSIEPAIAVRLRSARALANTRLEDGESARVEAQAALEDARHSGDRDALAMALHAVGEAARNEARHQDALRSFRELRCLTGPHQIAEEITSLQFLDRYDHAQVLLDEVRSSTGNATRSILPALHCAQVWQDFNLGRSDEAEAGAETLLQLGREFGSSVYVLDACIVQIALALLRGDTQRAVALLDQSDEVSQADDEVRRPGLTVMRGWLAAGTGDFAKAVKILRPIAEGATTSCSYWPLWPCWMGLFFEIGTAGADSAFTEAVIQISELAAARNPGVASFDGVALNLRGRNKGDVDMLARAAAILEGSPRPLLRGYGADCLGRALLATGYTEAGVEQLDRAWDEYQRIDAQVYRTDVERAMRAAGVRRAKFATSKVRPDSGWDSLTEAERRVALLIAEGHSNRSAAIELGVSVNTVGTHLRIVFSKLNVQSRVKLANMVRSGVAHESQVPLAQ